MDEKKVTGSEKKSHYWREEILPVVSWSTPRGDLTNSPEGITVTSRRELQQLSGGNFSNSPEGRRETLR